MLTEFHFDEDFLAAGDINGPNANIINGILLDFWIERGCLLYPESSFEEYREWISTIKPKYSMKWLAALTTGRVRNLDVGYKKISSFKNINQVKNLYLQTGMDLILVPNEFNSLGVDDTVDIAQGNNLEISKINGILNSKTYLRSLELCDRGTKVGDDINKIWSEQFKKTAKNSKIITIIDRYLGANLIEDISKKRTAVDIFVDFLAQENTKFSLTIYTAGDQKGSEIYDQINNNLRKKMTG